MDALQIDVFSDVACPWCWVGKRHLEQAIEAYGADVEVRWRAFQLNAAAPKTLDAAQGDYVGRLAKKYGVPRAGGQQMVDRMTSVGKDLGLDYRFDRAQATNTFDAHRLLAWSLSRGRQMETKEALFRAYMTDGKSVAEHEVLADVAEAAGLDPEAALAMLASDDCAAEVREDLAEAVALGVTGVPFFIVDRTRGVQGAQPAAALLEVLQHAAKERPAKAAAPSCDIDGC